MSDSVREISYSQAILEAEREELERDEAVVLIGEDLAMLAEHALSGLGPKRIWSAPISENGFVGMAVGAAMTGLRPIVDLTFSSLLFVAMDQLISQAAKSRYMFGGQSDVPITLRAGLWYANAYGAHHSDRPYPMLMNVPGLKVVVPSTPADVKGLLKAAVRDPDPVVVFEDLNLARTKGPVPSEDVVVPLGKAAVRREGSDVTIVAIAACVNHALEAADALADEGISVEVVDPRSLVPLDREALLGSVAKTGRLVIADPANRTCGAAAEISALASEEVFDQLRGPIVRVTTPDVQIPFSPPLETPLYPDRDKLISAVHKLLGAGA